MGKRIVVYAGPSLTAQDRERSVFDWRPPATAGDLIALLADPPEKLCLIDGLFDSCAAPWHKELLLLMAAGTCVYGAASMGALRAAELDSLGMVGVGSIYQAYRDRRLKGDDEVALVHATESWSWKPLTVPMVEVRATLVAACRAGLLRREPARLIRQTVHDIHFDCRDWPAIAEACAGEGLLTRRQAELLEAMHVPLKRRDAIRCLDMAVAGGLVQSPPPLPPITFFTRRLASQQGVPLPSPQQLPRTG